MKKRSSFSTLPFLKKQWWTEDFCLRLFIAVSFVLLLFFYVSLVDFQPATKEDYLPLYEKQEQIVKNIDSVFEMKNVNVQIADSKYTFTLESDECDLIFTMDQSSLEVLSIEEKDHASSLWYILLLIFFAIASACILGLCYLLALLLTSCIVSFLFHQK